MPADTITKTYEPHAASSIWLTTADVARMLELTRHGVRWLVNDGILRCERLRSGQMLFRESEALRLVDKRAKARLAGMVPTKPPLGAGDEPRQLSLFGRARLHLVTGADGERALRDRVAKDPEVFNKCARVR